ncbi:hypothetical protein VTJ49DRAFT_2358 [Mycothermus thermophilus]|uniref:Uncharacterized protein n=1 Tax=Humicola insolens TaxID=85995 RepID=A0ABR3VRH4_HUMIN
MTTPPASTVSTARVLGQHRQKQPIKGEDDNDQRDVEEAVHRIRALASKPLSQVDGSDLIPLAMLCLCSDHQDEKQIAAAAFRWRMAIFLPRRGFIRTITSTSRPSRFPSVKEANAAALRNPDLDATLARVPDWAYGVVVNTIWREIQRAPLGRRLFLQPKGYERREVRDSLKRMRDRASMELQEERELVTRLKSENQQRLEEVWRKRDRELRELRDQFLASRNHRTSPRKEDDRKQEDEHREHPRILREEAHMLEVEIEARRRARTSLCEGNARLQNEAVELQKHIARLREQIDTHQGEIAALQLQGLNLQGWNEVLRRQHEDLQEANIKVG